MTETANVPGDLEGRAQVRSRLVDVAARLLHEHGPGGVTTRGVAAAAGVQAPTIYRLFGDKDGLLDAVAEHAAATFVAAKVAAVRAEHAEDADPLEDLRAAWHAQIAFGVANPAVFALLSDPERVQRSAAAQVGRSVLEARVHRLARTGRLGVEESRCVDLIQSAGTGVIQTLLSTPPERHDPALPSVMWNAVLSQVLVGSGGPAQSGDPAAAVLIAFRALAPDLPHLTHAERSVLVEWLDRASAATTATPTATPDSRGDPLG